MPLPIVLEKKRALVHILKRIGDGSESGRTGYAREESKEDKPRSDASAAKADAMRRFLSAFKAENPDDMAAALELFLELCEYKEGE